MRTFLYRCPITGKNVQGWAADDGNTADETLTVTCLVYCHVHLVDPKTGRMMGASEN